MKFMMMVKADKDYEAGAPPDPPAPTRYAARPAAATPAPTHLIGKRRLPATWGGIGGSSGSSAKGLPA